MTGYDRWTGAALALLLGLTACSCAAERSQVRREARQEEVLAELVEGYWHALRWQYYDMAVEYLEKDSDRGRLWEYLLSRQGVATIGDVTIYRIALDDDLAHATAFIRYELMISNQAVVRKVTAKQRWYLGEGDRWYLELDPEELTRLD